MITPFIPAWLVGLLAFVAAGCVAVLSYMPRLVRLAIVIPTVYFGCIYVWVSTTDLGYIQSVDIVRFGIVGLFFSEIVTIIPYLWTLYKVKLITLANRLRGQWGSDDGGSK